jgi:hypothetical protein
MMGTKERHFAPLIDVSVKGRPSIDPVVFFKLQLVMFFEDIRSEGACGTESSSHLTLTGRICSACSA